MEVKKITPGQQSCIYTMLKKLQLPVTKEDLVAGFTGGRTESTSDMTLDEAKACIKYLKSQDPEEQAAERMRRKIISMAHETGYRFPGTTKVDMKRLDSWCIQYGKFHKKLNQHTYAEMVELVTQFEKVYKDFLQRL